MSKTKEKTLMLAVMGVLTAIVIVLQALAIGIRFGTFSITLVLVPIVVGAALYGWKAGAWLGLVFGAVVLMTDAAAFLAVSVPGTVVTCLLKGILAGIAAAAVYRLLENKNRWAAILAAAVVCPVVNTGVFLLGCVVFFYDTVSEWAAGAGFANVGVYLIVGFVGINFLVETAINLCLSTVIVRVLSVVKKPAVEA
ncbi:MAG: ECF transporter S component [Oscillospiraceae bacterium]